MKLKSTCCSMEDSLPILLVSAKDKDAAAYIISEVIDTTSENIGKSEINGSELDCIWKIENKYYTANVWVHVMLDGENLEPRLTHLVEAHLIYLTNDECTGETAAETTLRRAGAAEAAHARVVAVDAAAEPPALAAACARARLEPVPLRAPPVAGDDDDDDGGERGPARVRAALHAHVWSGLEPRERTDLGATDRDRPSEGSDDEDEWSEWCSAGAGEGGEGGAGAEGSAEAERRERAFAAALARLPGAAAAARAGGGPREERLRRAERLVAAFCRALDAPID